MALYRKVSPVLWDDEFIIDADDFTRTVWFALLTGPQVTNLPGLMTATAAGIADVLRRDPIAVRACLEALAAVGRIQIDDRLRIIRIPRAPKHNEPENVNVLKGWWNTWKALPESALKRLHVNSLRSGFDLARARWAHDDAKASAWDDFWAKSFGTVQAEQEALAETVSKPTANRIETVSKPIGDGIDTISKPSDIQEQEQFQEQEQDPSGGSAAPSAPAPTTAPGPKDPGERESANPGTGEAAAPAKPSPKTAGANSQPQLLSLVPPKAPKAHKLPRPETTTGVAWRVWRELYAASNRKYGRYTQSPADGKVMAKMGPHAVTVAAEHGHPAGVEALLRFWFKSYLRDDGGRGFSLKDHKHGLQWFERGIPTYGTPWSKPERPNTRETRPEDLPARGSSVVAAAVDPDARIEVPKALLNALANVGRGAPSEGPTAEQLEQRRARMQEQVAQLVEAERTAQ